MKIATIIPMHNRARFIGRALVSVAKQTLPSSEIIVVDDASSDNSVEVVKDLANSIANVHLICLPKNVGASAARNIGVRHATAPIVAFLDSDDIWYPDKLQKQSDEFQANPGVVAVFSGSRVTYPNRSFAHIPAPEVTAQDLYFSNKLSTTSSAAILRSVFLSVGGFDTGLPSCEDWDLFIRLAEIGRIRVVQQELIEFTNHNEPRISNTEARILLGHDTVHRRIYDRLQHQPSLLRRVRGSHHATLADIFSSLIYQPNRAIGNALLAVGLWRSKESAIMLARVGKRVIRNMAD